MLLELIQWLGQSHPSILSLQSLGIRALMAFFTAIGIGFFAGAPMIAYLRRMKVGQAVRNNGPKTHLVKDGTPTMGGALILLAIGLSTLLWMDLSNRYVWVVLFVTLGYGWIGWVDDYRKVVHHDPKGMSAREKFAWQSAIGLISAVYFAFAVSAPEGVSVWQMMQQWVAADLPLGMPEHADLILPFITHFAYPLGILGFIILTFIVIVGTSNAVNLTDGLDGLAIVPSVLVGSGLGVFAYLSGYVDTAMAFELPYIHDSAELVILCSALAGAGLAFLWYNAHPAQVFMGDVGALALGGCLGAMAVIVRQEFVLAIMGGIFVVETLSVMIQTTYYRYSGGKRVFLMAPIHHHFELKGWKETKVVARFWIITIVLVIIGLSSLLIH